MHAPREIYLENHIKVIIAITATRYYFEYTLHVLGFIVFAFDRLLVS